MKVCSDISGGFISPPLSHASRIMCIHSACDHFLPCDTVWSEAVTEHRNSPIISAMGMTPPYSFGIIFGSKYLRASSMQV